MQEFSTAEFLLSFLVTWIVVLTPPAMIRAIRGKPIDENIAIGICVAFFFANLILFIAMGSQSKSHMALLLGAWLSYYILRWKTNSNSARLAHENRKALGYIEPPQSEGAVQPKIASPTVQADPQLTQLRWYQKALHRPMARLYVSFIPSAIVVFSIILIGGYLEVQGQTEAYTKWVPDSKERCGEYPNKPGSASDREFDQILFSMCMNKKPPPPSGNIWMNVQDAVPSAVLAWLAISATLFALLTAISIFKLETNSGWKRLSVVAGIIASVIVFSGSIFFSGEYDLKHNTVGVLVLGLALGLAAPPLAVIILLGGRNLVGWIKAGFEQI